MPSGCPTRKTVAIDKLHAEVHEGDYYRFCVYDADLDAAETLEYIITTPNTDVEIHFIWDAIGALTTLVQLFEDTTHTVNVQQTVFNAKRLSSNTATATVHTSNNDNADGTQIDCASFGIDTGVGILARSGGGNSRGDIEWILDKNSKYLIRLTSGAENNNATLKFGWYEED